MRRSLVVSLALLAIVRAPAVAQSCLGLTSFSAAPIQVAGNATFSDLRNSWGGSLSYGLPSGLFAGASVSTTSFDGLDSHSMGVGANVGYEMTLGQTSQFHLCPVASFGLGMGPDDETGNIDRSSRTANIGLALGTSMGANPRLKIMPTAGLGLAYDKAKVDNGGAVTEGSETYGLARLGVGFVFNQNIAVRPSVDIPLGLDNSDATFGVTVAYNFGSKGASRAPRKH